MKPKLTTERTTELRSITDLREHPKQHEYFNPLSGEGLQALAADIKQHGLTTPIEITPDNVIICGHQRVRAYQQLKRKQIECWVRHDLAEQGEQAVELRLLDDNTHRRQLTKLEQARLYMARKKLAKGKSGGGDCRDAVAKQFKMSGRTLDRLAMVLRTPIEVQRAFEDGQLNLGQATQVATLSAEDQEAIADQISAGEAPTLAVSAYLKRKAPKGAPKKITLPRILARLNAVQEMMELGIDSSTLSVASIKEAQAAIAKIRGGLAEVVSQWKERFAATRLKLAKNQPDQEPTRRPERPDAA